MALRQEPQPLGTFLGRFYQQERGAEHSDIVIRDALERGQALVLLDGLDEIDEDGRARVVRAIADFLAIYQATGNRIIVTSRPASYQATPLPGRYPSYTLLALSDAEVQTLSQHWDRLHTNATGKATTASLSAILGEQPKLAELAHNPLMLTMLAALHAQGHHLPHRRVEIYEEYLRMLVETWQRNRSESRQPLPITRTWLEVKPVLADLAAWLHQQSSGTVRRAVLMRELRRILKEQGFPPDERTAERWLEAIQTQSGLVVEHELDQWGFSHRSFHRTRPRGRQCFLEVWAS